MVKKISIVTPTFNEQENIERLCSSISNEMNKLNYDYEHIIIDNCSNDNTISIIKKIAEKNKKIKIILNKKNFGHIRSPIHAMLQSSGDACILMSADFQDPPELISTYLKEWENGYEIVLGQKESSDESFYINIVRKLFYRFIKSISEEPLMIDVTGAGLIDKKIIKNLKEIDDPYPYLRGLLSEISGNIKLIKFHQPKRHGGKTKNNFYTLYDIAMLGIVKHSKKPLRIATIIGFCASLISIITAFIFLIYKILFWDSFELGVAPLIVGLFAVASIQIFLLGLIGEYVMSILTQTRKLPLVIEKERINF